MGFLRRAGLLALKDLRLEWRTGEKLSSMAFFALLLLVILHFAFDFTRLEFENVGVGVLWVCVTFAGIVGLGHSFVVEREDGCLQGLLLCPGDRSAVFLGKFVSNAVFVLLVEALVLPLAGRGFRLFAHFAGAGDLEALFVEQLLDHQYLVDVRLTVPTAAGTILPWPERGKLALPVA